MNIVILGAGAMGSAIGALLHQAGHPVTLIDVWAEAIESIQRDGLRIQNKIGDIGTHRVRAVTRPDSSLGPVDLLLVFVKCYHTADAVRSALPILGPDSTVLSLQNGWGNGPRIAEIVGPERVLLGVCYHSATVLGPGHVLHAGQGKTFIGEIDGRLSARVRSIAEVFNAAGIVVEPSSTVLKEIWSKLALNVATLPTQSAIRLTAEKLPSTPEMRHLMRELLGEVVAVANAQGLGLDVEERWQVIMGLLSRLAPNSKGSMLQDVEKGRATEIDVMCGAVLEVGRRLGIATPYNDALYCLIKAVEGNYSNA